MILARVCRATLSPQAISFLKQPVISKPLIPKTQCVRLFNTESRGAFTRTVRNKVQTVEEAFTAPKDTAFNIDKGAVAGASALGLGALCYYELSLSSETGAIEESELWPQYVKDRIHSTYLYFGGSIFATGAAAAACMRSPTVMRFVTKQGWIALAGTMVAMVGTSMIVQSIPYKEGVGAKQLAWLVHMGTVGAVLAPLSMFGGALLVRAAWYTAGVVGGLSTIAVCAPSDKFLNMGGPLAIGLGLVFASSIGSMFLPPTTVIGSGVHSMALYGGLLLFSMFLLYDTQKIMKKAQMHPMEYGESRYDPVNNAMHIYMDTLNIFVRILTIVSGGGNRRK